ncbi:hypothetical protein LIER_10253 [Lithospermum erythrorhizon]|uniref:Retrovirus-related Pol polyprotein from transposon TNT 1-94-like beta-barrel domain-containing protein n=1 Tax=Lithospermum erythrorhizon TaxID=34254 RepID=A0AAV3PIR4_LITER
MGVTFSDEVQALWLLGTLLESWETLCVSLSSSSTNGTLNKEVMSNAILHENIRRGTSSEKSLSNVHDTLSKSKDKKVGSGDICYTSTDEDWVIDTGASFHVTLHKHFFNTYKEGDFGEARMGNDGLSKIIAIGDVLVKTCIGEIITLRDVRYISDFWMNLISFGKLDDQGYTNIFGKGQWKLVKDSQIIAKGMKIGALYRSKFEVINNHVNIVDLAWSCGIIALVI